MDGVANLLRAQLLLWKDWIYVFGVVIWVFRKVDPSYLLGAREVGEQGVYVCRRAFLLLHAELLRSPFVTEVDVLPCDVAFAHASE